MTPATLCRIAATRYRWYIDAMNSTSPPFPVKGLSAAEHAKIQVVMSVLEKHTPPRKPQQVYLLGEGWVEATPENMQRLLQQLKVPK